MITKIPNPTGPFGVGKSIHTLVDTSRKEKYDQGYRELLVYIYYPTHEKAVSAYAQDIMPILKNNLQQSLNVDLESLQYLDSFKEHSSLQAPLIDTQQKLPVLFFSPGLGDPVETYSTLLEEMASQGYVIVAINYPYAVDPTVFPNGEIIRMNEELAGFWYVKHCPFEDIVDNEHEWWLQDAHFVINSITNISPHDSYNFLKDKIDYNAMGVFGHSLGGSLALQLCRERTDLKACVDLDGIMFGPESKRLQIFTTPTMFITAGKQVTLEELEKHKIPKEQFDYLVLPRAPKLLYDKLQYNAFFITIENARHNSFSDLDLLRGPFKETENPLGIIQQIRSMLVQFFNCYLKKQLFNTQIIKSLPNVIFESKN
jgi:hypothetical protein